ncbi:MAG: hypothetical protein LBO02_00055 [Holosporaceae bacterium]|jgi:predicted DNA-binding transcriptional regulator AlpA|nr:hypothetical protein [Holosporaceae bacterium]
MKLTTLIDGKEVLDTKQVLELTKFSNSKLHELMRHDKFIKPFRYKNKNFWKKSEIDAYIENTKK